MIDIHTHILPGIDDGAASEADALALARLAVQEGIHTVVATPHRNAQYPNEGQDVLRRVQDLQGLLDQEGIDLEVLPGIETRIHGDFLQEIEEGDILTVNNRTKCVFVEFNFTDVPDYAEPLFYEMQLAGYTPVIVHPERNAAFRDQSDRLYQFVKKGALTQVTAGSLTGAMGKQVRKFSHDMIEANLCHMIASDAHHVKKRPFHMKAAYEEIGSRHGRGTVSQLKYNAEAILYQDVLDISPPAHMKKGFFAGFFQK